MSIRVWLGRVAEDGVKFASVTQSGASGLHVVLLTLNPSGGAVARDGTAAALVDRSTPYEHTGITPVGTRDMLVVAHAGVQFTPAVLAHGAAPAGMTAVTVPQGGDAGHSSLQVCWEQRSSAAATGTRQQTSNVGTLSGGAGLRFLLRAEGDAPAAAGPEPGRFFLVLG